MKTLIALVFLLSVHAQVISQDPARHEIGKEGQIFTIKIQPKDGLVDIRLVDAPLVRIEPGRLQITARASDFGRRLQAVPLVEKNNELRLGAPISPHKTYEFQIRDKISQKSEVIRIPAKP